MRTLTGQASDEICSTAQRVARGCVALAVAALLPLSACARGNNRPGEASTAKPANSAPEAEAAVSVPSGNTVFGNGPDNAPPPHFNGARALQYAKEVVALGPRPVGSAAHAKLENYLRAHLKDNLEEDAFTADTPAGPKPMRNFIAKFPGTREGIILVGGHYDTLYGRSDFVGANDGGSSTALLLELANELRAQKRTGYSVWLVWFDGEEAFQQWTLTDSVYGSRHLAEKWEKDGTLKRIKAYLLADMIGDADLNIDRDLVYEAATRLGTSRTSFAARSAWETITRPLLPVASRQPT
jgi:hypothetical protein